MCGTDINLFILQMGTTPLCWRDRSMNSSCPSECFKQADLDFDLEGDFWVCGADYTESTPKSWEERVEPSLTVQWPAGV